MRPTLRRDGSAEKIRRSAQRRAASTTVSVTVTGPSGPSTVRVCDSATRTSHASAGRAVTTRSGVNSSSGCPWPLRTPDVTSSG